MRSTLAGLLLFGFVQAPAANADDRTTESHMGAYESLGVATAWEAFCALFYDGSLEGAGGDPVVLIRNNYELILERDRPEVLAMLNRLADERTSAETRADEWWDRGSGLGPDDDEELRQLFQFMIDVIEGRKE